MQDRAKAAKIVDILTRARAAISDPGDWGKGSWESDGRACALGAIDRVTGTLGHNEVNGDAYDALGRIASKIRPQPNYELEWCAVWRYNDDANTTHADIMALFDLAIEEQCKIVRGEDDNSSNPAKA